MIDYTWISYKYCVYCYQDDPFLPKIPALASRKTSNVQNPGTWAFTYYDRSVINGEDISTSTVTTPYSNIEYKFHTVIIENAFDKNYSQPNLIGYLKQKQVRDKVSGTLIEEVLNTWGADRTVTVDAQVGRVYVTPIKQMLKTQQKITREGTTYTTNYSNFDSYGNPQTIVEVGNAGSKTQHLTYVNDADKWIIGKRDRVTIDGIGLIMDYDYDVNGNLIKQNQLGVITNSTYYANGNLKTQTDANGNLTSFNNYYLGIPQQQISSEGVVINRTINAAGLTNWQKDGEGNQASFQNTSHRRLSKINNPLGADSIVTWDTANENSIGYTITRGNYIKIFRWDGFGRVTSINDGGIKVKYGYDAIGRKKFESFPDSHGGIITQYDALGRTTSITRAGTAIKRFTYLANNTVEVMNEEGKISYWYYHSYGDPDKKELIKHRTPIADTWITRNKLGLMTKVQQGARSSAPNGLSRSYGYNGRWQITSMTDPETGVSLFGRDTLGNMTSSKVGNSATTLMTYDGLSRLKTVNYPSGTADVSLTYDRNSQIKSVSNGVVRAFTYNANQKRTSETMSIDGLSFKSSYVYDNKDALSSMTYPSGEVSHYAPDALGRATQTGGYVTGVAYHPTNEPRIVNYVNGTSLTSTLNSNQEVETMYAPGLMDLTYDYDDIGNTTSITDGIDGSYSLALGYDGANRLTSASGKWGAGSINYNANGDITKKAMGADTKNYNYSNGKLNLLNGKGFAYDYYGNVHTNHRGIDFNFNDASQLTEANGVKYTYDGGGSLVKKESGPFITYYYYDYKKSAKLGEYDADGSPLSESFYLNDRMVAAKRYKKKTWVPIGVSNPFFIQVLSSMSTPEKTYYHWNGLGSTMAATNPSGTLLWKEDYQPFGKQIRGEEDGRTSVFYNSKHFDKDSGLIYLAARWYDPDMGRFISTDPLRYDENDFNTFNRYAYANNNPFFYQDPSGLRGVRCSRPNCHRTFYQIIHHKIWPFYDGFTTFRS